MLLLNAFSFNMVNSFPVQVTAEELTFEQARELAPTASSAVGHPDTARVFSAVLGCTVAPQRATIALASGELALVGQYRGPRLAEGATELPQGAAIQWLLIRVH